MFNEQTTRTPKVAIIGAGIAGLSCAIRLQNLGFEVRVYEKSSRSSGRMSTRIGENWSADHGAQYFTARNPLFVEELHHWIKAGIVNIWNPRLQVFKANEWQDRISKEVRYVASPSMNTLGQYLAKNLPVTLNQTINRIDYQNQQWMLHSLETGPIEQAFDWLVLALPAPQTLTLTKSIDQSIETLANQANMRGCWTLMARFTEGLNMPFDAAFINDEIISWVCRNNSKPGRVGDESWTIHANPQWSEQNIEANEKEVTQLIIQCAEKLGFDFRNSNITIHRWRYANGYIPSTPEFYTQKDLRLGVCGDWLHGGRVEGAWLSAYKLANNIVTLNESLI